MIKKCLSLLFIKRIFIILLLTVILLIIVYINADRSNIVAQNGTLDLTNWNQDESIDLSGTWDFYWKRLLDYKEISSGAEPDAEFSVPSVWNNCIINGDRLPGKGYATYRLHVTGVKKNSTFALRVPPFSTSYDLYINDKLMASSGTVGTNETKSIPHYRLQSFKFTPEGDSFDIIIHISNYCYARGGAWYTLCFGTAEQISNLNDIIYGRDAFLIGIYIFLFPCTLFFYYLKKDKGLILFAVLCILLLSRTVIYGSYVVNTIFPSIPFKAVVCIDYINLFFLPSISLAIIYLIFPAVGIRKGVITFSLAYSLAGAVMAIILPIYITTQFINLFQLIYMVQFSYLMAKLLAIMMRGSARDIQLVFIGHLIAILCVVRDTLYQNNILFHGEMEHFPVGCLIMLIFWHFAFIINYETLAKEREHLLDKLNIVNQKERILELKFLKSQIQPHFINNTLAAIISISRTDYDRTRDLLIELSKYLQSCYDLIGIHDAVPLENELTLVESYLELLQARFEDRLKVRYEIDKVSIMIPPLVLQPLVENSVKHGMKRKKKGISILVYVKDQGAAVRVGVIDDGGGITQETVSKILNNSEETGGIGIYNINKRLMMLFHTSLQIDVSEKGMVDAYMMIPKDKPKDC